MVCLSISLSLSQGIYYLSQVPLEGQSPWKGLKMPSSVSQIPQSGRPLPWVWGGQLQQLSSCEHVPESRDPQSAMVLQQHMHEWTSEWSKSRLQKAIQPGAQLGSPCWVFRRLPWNVMSSLEKEAWVRGSSSLRNILSLEINTPIPYQDKVSTTTIKCEIDLWKITSECRHSNGCSLPQCLCGCTHFQSATWGKSLIFHIELMGMPRKSPSSLRSHASAAGFFL